MIKNMNIKIFQIIFTSLFFIACTNQESNVKEKKENSVNVESSEENTIPEFNNGLESDKETPSYNTQFGENEQTKKETNQNNFEFIQWDGNSLKFFPKNVYLILIYEGKFTNFDEALLSSESPTARVPAKSSCAQDSSTCLVSPVAKKDCIGCENLISTKVYSAFLQKNKNILTSNVVPIILGF
jgi:hypothetical protein